MHFTGTVWRPPYEAYSTIIQVTAGCTHHNCKFCSLYADLPFKFRMSPMSEIEKDLQELKTYNPCSKRVFMTGANPFALDYEKLNEIASMIKSYLPKVQTIGCFSRVTDIKKITFIRLRRYYHRNRNRA